MTTLSISLKLPEDAAEDLRRLSSSAGQTESEFISEHVLRLTEKVRTHHELKINSADLKSIREELRPHREASRYESEDDFLKRSA